MGRRRNNKADQKTVQSIELFDVSVSMSVITIMLTSLDDELPADILKAVPDGLRLRAEELFDPNRFGSSSFGDNLLKDEAAEKVWPVFLVEAFFEENNTDYISFSGEKRDLTIFDHQSRINLANSLMTILEGLMSAQASFIKDKLGLPDCGASMPFAIHATFLEAMDDPDADLSQPVENWFDEYWDVMQANAIHGKYGEGLSARDFGLECS